MDEDIVDLVYPRQPADRRIRSERSAVVIIAADTDKVVTLACKNAQRGIIGRAIAATGRDGCLAAITEEHIPDARRVPWAAVEIIVFGSNRRAKSASSNHIVAIDLDSIVANIDTVLSK